MTSIAKRAHNLTISVYAFRTGRCDILLGETQVPLANLDRTGKGNISPLSVNFYHMMS